MQCEMCGKGSVSAKVKVEGVLLSVCSGCSKHGEFVSREGVVVKKPKKVFVKKAERQIMPEYEEEFVDDFSKLIRKKRQSLNLTQEELAKKISIKESLVKGVEAGSLFPSIGLMKKFERFLGLVLFVKKEKKKLELKKVGGEGMTIGDLLK